MQRLDAHWNLWYKCHGTTSITHLYRRSIAASLRLCALAMTAACMRLLSEKGASTSACRPRTLQRYLVKPASKQLQSHPQRVRIPAAALWKEDERGHWSRSPEVRVSPSHRYTWFNCSSITRGVQTANGHIFWCKGLVLERRSILDE